VLCRAHPWQRLRTSPLRHQDRATTNRRLHRASRPRRDSRPCHRGPSVTANQTMPDSWIGNLFSVNEGAAIVPGMLAEFRFNGFAGATYFDVSAIVNPDDTEGVKMVFPKNNNSPISGCQTFPCSNAYNKWERRRHPLHRTTASSSSSLGTSAASADAARGSHAP